MCYKLANKLTTKKSRTALLISPPKMLITHNRSSCQPIRIHLATSASAESKILPWFWHLRYTVKRSSSPSDASVLCGSKVTSLYFIPYALMVSLVFPLLLLSLSIPSCTPLLPTLCHSPYATIDIKDLQMEQTNHIRISF